MLKIIATFIRSQSGAITVDWVVLVSAAFGLATATAALIFASMQFVTANLDSELREQQLSDSFVQFQSAVFDYYYDNEVLTEEEAEQIWNTANDMMNYELTTFIDSGVQMMADGELDAEQSALLLAMIDVAIQRNILSEDAISQDMVAMTM